MFRNKIYYRVPLRTRIFILLGTIALITLLVINVLYKASKVYFFEFDTQPVSLKAVDLIKNEKDQLAKKETNNVIANDYLEINDEKGWEPIDPPTGPLDEAIVIKKKGEVILYWKVWYQLDKNLIIVQNQSGLVKALPTSRYGSLKRNGLDMFPKNGL